MILDIWQSYRRLPIWVQLWVALILVPVNAASLVFLGAPMGAWVAVMAVGAMLLNGVIMLVERGFSKMMALPHVLIWTPLVVLILWLLAKGDLAPGYARYLMVLLAVDLFSLALDYADTVKWLKGERHIA
ncbi:hypothetical protein SAMN05444414_10123 [Roseovarius marisflavi]|uniref:Uncharacterized protein n=1 Tax=Roseovarius marisflavi TaxID=1054996 RepID=A0A1M6V0A8_9RHOB|nr:hypothetical protein [Roseovarius marisflavi]SHK74834.1 hypothetical protein SAMN05444414_10123 [Roseovarius marisflavi]